MLTEAAVLRGRMAALPRDPEARSADGAVWWRVWEEFCDTGQRAAIEAGRWDTALEFNAELCAVKTGRGAPGTDVAQARFPAYTPLLRLGRVTEALALLHTCREVFEAAQDVQHLGEVFGALATVEHARGRGSLALARGRDCLRYAYRGGHPAAIAVSHVNHGSFLHAHARDAPGAAAHHLAGALLGLLTGGRTADALGAVVNDVRVFGPAATPLPAGPRELCERVAEVPGVALDRLLTRLCQDGERVAETLAGLVRQVREAAGTGPAAGGAAGPGGAAVAARLVWLLVWEPALGALLAAERGNTAARVKLRQHLHRWGELDERFARPAAVLRRVLDGERDPAVAAGLGPLDEPVAARALAALRGGTDVAAELWPVMHLGLALGNLAAAASGYGETAEVTRENLAGLRADPSHAPLAPVLGEILAGARDPALATRLELPAHRAAVAAVLRCVEGIERA
ncbi:hypothetical protein [Streptomyces sp. NPDC005017]|uniref:hypothetical protein n=1 Tax=Streptomyces sp. NPDC005017 TaxID=3364706 RepID=UPI0036C6B934